LRHQRLAQTTPSLAIVDPQLIDVQPVPQQIRRDNSDEIMALTGQPTEPSLVKWWRGYLHRSQHLRVIGSNGTE
jgi:hypothetical protein